MKTNLERSLGLPSVMAIAISAMLGSGIFVLPGLAAAATGRSAWLAYVVAGLCVLPAALSKAELATAMPASGGSFVYLDRAFGPWAGTVAGLSLWASMWLKATFALLGFGAYLAVVTPVGPDGAKAAALVSLGAVAGINFLGAKRVGRAQLLVVGVGVACLVVAVVAGLWGLRVGAVPTPPPAPLFREGVTGLLAATGLVFVSFNGVTKVAAIAEEVENPKRTLPLGILLSLVMVTFLYATVAYTMAAVLPLDAFSGDIRPVYSMVAAMTDPRAPAAWAAGVLGVVIMTSMANAGLLAASRFPFAMSRDHLLPPTFSRISARWQTPTAAIAITVAVMALAIVLFDVAALAKLASGTVILIFMAEMVATITLRESRATWYTPGFRAPLYPWLQGAGLLAGLALLWQLGAISLVAALGGILPGSALYLTYGRRRTQRRGVLGKVGRRRDLSPASSRAETEVAHAEVIVALLGGERSPEMLTELGLALAEGGDVLATQLREREPDAALIEDERHLDSVTRRLRATGARYEASLSVSAVETSDLVRTVHAMSHRLQNKWFVVSGEAGATRAFTRLSPLGWAVNHLGANLAIFLDRGVRYPTRVLVVPRPGPHDALAVTAAADLATAWSAELRLVGFAADRAPEAEVAMQRAYLEDLRRLAPATTTIEVLRGASATLAVADESVAHDLVVLGAPELSLRSLVFKSLEERIADRVACSVVTVKTPRGETHAAVDRHDEAVPTRALDFVSPEVVLARLAVDTRDELFATMSERFADALDHRGGPTVPPSQIQAAFVERERAQSTMVGDGVALPHASINGIAHTLLGVFTVANPLSFEPGGDTIEVVFATIGPPTARFDHLRVLRAVARLTLHPEALAAIVEATDTDGIYAALELAAEPVADADHDSYDAQP
ncbi:MAG: amino acid permease [Myxococcota bacterium]